MTLTTGYSISEMSGIEFSEVVRNWAIVVGGAIGLGLAIWRGLSHDRQARAQVQQANIAQRAHITEVFTNAVALLRDDKLEIRMGAVTSLIQIADDYPNFGRRILDLLQTYVRERSTDADEVDPAVDIQTIISFVNERAREANGDVH